ncbi:CatA-like O-acetyltransferase [Pseudoalteromonas piscicida]|uniref:Chloramphenicol acetyltransferase n=1 Tax=Pseudoalteromonas piscicida TaxID=43662 RepID=A0A2A5JQZ5_PSEO7|nr:CatA-like O-acetyltransferase [Pseudoalteromonas piscicida]PCK31787.1 chloramphenicol acetyltransferase [Pseudoalteromonas piscicida]
MKKKISLDNWPRQEHYSFFKDFEQPYFTVTVSLQMERVYEMSKRSAVPFSLSCLYALQLALNSYAPIRYRLESNEVVEYKEVEISSVFLREDDTFRFVRLAPEKEFSRFISVNLHGKAEQLNGPLISEQFLSESTLPNCVHVSILPWLSFSSFGHARHSKDDFGIPKFVFGKYNKADGTMPFCIEVHHALMDGLHVAEFVRVLQEKIDQEIWDK